MALAYPQYIAKKHTADKAAAVSGAVIIYAVQILGGSAATTVQLVDALTDTSSDELMYAAVINDSILFDYSHLGGVAFSTGLTVDIQTTGGAVIIWTSVAQATA